MSYSHVALPKSLHNVWKLYLNGSRSTKIEINDFSTAVLHSPLIQNQNYLISLICKDFFRQFAKSWIIQNLILKHWITKIKKIAIAKLIRRGTTCIGQSDRYQRWTCQKCKNYYYYIHTCIMINRIFLALYTETVLHVRHSQSMTKERRNSFSLKLLLQELRNMNSGTAR